jgi:hypothetical protein
MSKPKNKGQTATVTINFEDGTTKEIKLNYAVEINTSADKLKCLEIRETRSGEWILSFTASLFEGKKLKTFDFKKDG